MIQKWANNLPDRRTIEEFLDWLMQNRPGETCLAEINWDLALNEYHGIDLAALEQERRAVLETYAQQ